MSWRVSRIQRQSTITVTISAHDDEDRGEHHPDHGKGDARGEKDRLVGGPGQVDGLARGLGIVAADPYLFGHQ